MRRLRRYATPVLAAIVLAISAAACSSSEEPRVEDFPLWILGTWEQVGGPAGTLTFEGSESSGVGVRSAFGFNAESFTYQWVAPAQIRTNLGDDIELTVLFEDGGDTLVLASGPDAATDEIFRYSRVE